MLVFNYYISCETLVCRKGSRPFDYTSKVRTHKEVYGVMHIDNATAMVDKAATTHNDSIVIIPQHINLQIIL